MIDSRIVNAKLQECGALLEGHFLLTSGRHSDRYIEKAEIYTNPLVIDDFCWQIAKKVSFQFEAIEIVVGLAPIGVTLASRVAQYLYQFYQQAVISIFTEKDREQMVFKRGYAGKVGSKKVLIVDDVLTTGQSVEQVKTEIERHGGEVIAIVVICQRGKIRSKALEQTPILTLTRLEMKDWSQKECPLCQAGIAVFDPKAR